MLEEFLMEQGYQVTTAESGTQAIKKITGESFSLVICDIKMPGLDGIKTLFEIKRINKLLPVIMMSGFNPQQQIKEIAGKGAVAFLAKPLNLFQTEKIIQQALVNTNS